MFTSQFSQIIRKLAKVLKHLLGICQAVFILYHKILRYRDLKIFHVFIHVSFPKRCCLKDADTELEHAHNDKYGR